MVVPVAICCPSEVPLKALIESVASALGLCLGDVRTPTQQALGLCTPNLERLLGGQREGAPSREHTGERRWT